MPVSTGLVTVEDFAFDPSLNLPDLIQNGKVETKTSLPDNAAIHWGDRYLVESRSEANYGTHPIGTKARLMFYHKQKITAFRAAILNQMKVIKNLTYLQNYVKIINN